MSLAHVAAGLAGVTGFAIVVIGVRCLLAPVRDVVSGLLGLALLAAGQFREPGWFLIIVALISIGDALIS